MQEKFAGRYAEFGIPCPEMSEIRLIIASWFRLEQTPLSVCNFTEQQIKDRAFKVLEGYVDCNLQGWEELRVKIDNVTMDYWSEARAQQFNGHGRRGSSRHWARPRVFDIVFGDSGDQKSPYEPLLRNVLTLKVPELLKFLIESRPASEPERTSDLFLSVVALLQWEFKLPSWWNGLNAWRFEIEKMISDFKSQFHIVWLERPSFETVTMVEVGANDDGSAHPSDDGIISAMDVQPTSGGFEFEDETSSSEPSGGNDGASSVDYGDYGPHGFIGGNDLPF